MFQWAILLLGFKLVERESRSILPVLELMIASMGEGIVDGDEL